MFTQKQKTIAYRVLMAIYLVALGPNYTFGYATQDNPTNRFFLIANLLSIVALVLAAVWIDRPKFFKAVSAMMVIVAILGSSSACLSRAVSLCKVQQRLGNH
ncbi:hypothetical protein [Lactobacillus delbrueckii]|uniref:hypothetical protein n=1 Tax=Lactobacillus delbrueckii TaxID=1584 RepID=UPI001E2A366D|nr:hypothetical protein [Lactobacillus delbrueckii]MCD5516280.1 hypothetical protein [Lactobacillus delbrueckii subsp. lactis]MCD5522067.1 hypothetical protein [Lactobacillus delbrueckii subsp. lactis]